MEKLGKKVTWLTDINKHQFGAYSNYGHYTIIYGLKSWDDLEDVATKLMDLIAKIADGDNDLPPTFIYSDIS